MRHASPCLTLIISDNGIGLPTTRQNGVGLTSMQERAEELGGTLLIGTLIEGGTCPDYGRIAHCIRQQD